ncbi:MAG: bifunctional folylpolyglutamate synthase/dihydrofolate synthase [Streptosporangiaceae bacterium]|nr:bifunctional folylpolyglutamate synthase/dihydrofolate synthase [Streptosporangiaceae bacterium]MBV9857224.1 bifunctional folylpolyglutamate synthase/dihydrofolate synthase [Streptosporangiaceae bacterium]
METGERLREVEREIAARRPEHAISPTLDRIAMLTGLLGDPQRACPVIHVTGTNGKTSMTRMIDALLRERGLRTGRFTSPHLVSMRERIAIDGQPIGAERFTGLYEEILPYVRLTDEKQPVPLSFFEVLTGMAFAAFADAPVDVAVIEVGLGGSWDATNVADGMVAVVGPVAMDHMNYLGDTLEEIAGEKAGIIKAGAVAILAQQPVPAAEVLMRRVAEAGASVAREGIEFGVIGRELAVGGQQLTLRGLRGTYDEVFLPLFGAYQAGNAVCSLAAVEAFAGVGGGADPLAGADGLAAPGGAVLDPALVRDAFAKISSPGRLEVLRRSPTVIADAAHNPAGMAATVEALLESFSLTRLVGVLAVSEDKDVAGLLEELEPVLSDIVVTRNSSARSMAPERLAEIAAEIFGEDRTRAADRLDDAIEIAVAIADEPSGDDLPGGSGVLITGSVITAGDARLLLAPGVPADAPEPPAGTPARHSFTVGDLS